MPRITGRASTWRTLLCSLLLAAALPLTAAPPADAAPVMVVVREQPGAVERVASRRLLVTGDSITQGSSGDYTWRYRLWKKLQTTAPGQVTFVGTKSRLYDNVNNVQGSPHYAVPYAGSAHAATWGAFLADEVNRVGDQVTRTGANTVVAMLGINDIIWHGTSASELKALYRTYVERARAAAPGIDVVLCAVLSRYDFFDKSYHQVAETRAVAGELKALAAEMSTPSQRVVFANTLNGWDARLHTWDSTHPNPTGETLIAQRVSAALASMGVGTATPSIYRKTPWTVRPAAPAVAGGAEEATVGWNRTSTGSTAMYVEYDLTNEKDGFVRLPYGIADQDDWRISPLVAGGRYAFRTVPIKGFMTGRPGATTTRSVTAKQFQRTVPTIDARQSPQGFHGLWSKADNAQGYLLSFRKMAYHSPITRLPYPVDADTTEWAIYPLPMGRYYQFRAVPVRGYVTGTWRSSANVRTAGLTMERSYIALGDSYSSGLGVHRDVDDYNLDRPCRRTTGAWAFKMQDKANAATKLIACQADEIDEGLDDGVRAQLRRIQPFFALRPHAAQLVSVTVGGNDVGFTSKLKYCQARDCATSESDWYGQITAMAGPLHDFYNDLRDAAPNADIVVGGYPEIIDAYGKRWDPVCRKISESERKMFTRLVDHLNGVIDYAAEKSLRTGRYRTPIWSAASFVRARFKGHGACQYGDEEWIHSYTTGGGLVGDGIKKVGMNSFHPKPVGQAGYAYGFADALVAKAGRW
ncbi:GDSL-type esterase/lipase family protein [Nocardioides stalactiti]|uniref:GDSL-type esterase/lipase family protein n=1 Tax=Nocardioides stalactiti TaxID=2755356 RepID=UPI001603365A|nr:GDSL-type esterase/lipase family protein [Nocardioides stalactiti]